MKVKTNNLYLIIYPVKQIFPFFQIQIKKGQKNAILIRYLVSDTNVLFFKFHDEFNHLNYITT